MTEIVSDRPRVESKQPDEQQLFFGATLLIFLRAPPRGRVRIVAEGMNG